MKASSKQGKELLAKVEPVQVGQKIGFGPLFKGLTGECTGHCTEREQNRYWVFSMYWQSVHLVDVSIERVADELSCEVR